MQYTCDFELTRAEGSAGWDIRAPHDIWLPPGHIVEVKTTLRFNLEDGKLFLLLLPRSSAGVKGLYILNTAGVIDPSFCGPDDEIKLWLGRRETPAGEVIGTFGEDSDGGTITLFSGKEIEFDNALHMKPVRTCDDFGRWKCLEPFARAKVDRGGDLLYKRGERFAQAVICHFVPGEGLRRVDKFEGVSRGGFGSTGMQ